MQHMSREEAKKVFRANEIRILKDQWFQQDLREAEMRSQLDQLDPLSNFHKRQQIHMHPDLQGKEADRKAAEFKRKTRMQQLEGLQKMWREQDRREAAAQAEAHRIFRELNGLKQPFQ
jgi:hypothetical protein